MPVSDIISSLIEQYETVLDLYRELERLSLGMSEVLEGKAPMETLPGLIKEKLAVVGRVQERSRAITILKKELAEAGGDREPLRRLEQELTELVDRVVASEDKGRLLMEREGLRITRTGR